MLPEDANLQLKEGGNELGKLRRQAFDRYLEWAEKLKRHPDLLMSLQEVGRNVHQYR